MAFLPTEASTGTSYNVRGAALIGVAAEVSLTHQIAVHLPTELRPSKGPTSTTDYAGPVVVTTLFSNEPAVGITYPSLTNEHPGALSFEISLPELPPHSRIDCSWFDSAFAPHPGSEHYGHFRDGKRGKGEQLPNRTADCNVSSSCRNVGVCRCHGTADRDAY